MSRPKHPRRPRPDADDPVALARAGDELQARLSRLRATIEKKRRVGWNFTPRAAAAGASPPEAC
jgi:hypothetical protein